MTVTLGLYIDKLAIAHQIIQVGYADLGKARLLLGEERKRATIVGTRGRFVLEQEILLLLFSCSGHFLVFV